MFVSPISILKNAKKRRYAIGAFNIHNLESLQAIVKACENLHCPVILATTEGTVEYAGLDYILSIANVAATKAKVPVVLHLDHGKNIDLIKQCINRGYTSVMFDGSHFPLAKNIRLTKKVVQMAHKMGVAVEGEVGTIGGSKDSVRARKILYTEPEVAKKFVKETGIDTLAVAIGTSHGAYKFSVTPKLDIKRLRAISLSVGIPLVLHGASGVPKSLVSKATRFGAKLKNAMGVPDSQIRQAIRNGIAKINIDTDLRLSFTEAIREIVKKHPSEIDPRHYLNFAKNKIQKMVESKIRVFGSKGST